MVAVTVIPVGLVMTAPIKLVKKTVMVMEFVL